MYGGLIENCVCLLFEVVDVVIDVWGVGWVGVYFVLCGDVYMMGDFDLVVMFGYVVCEFGCCKIVFIFMCELYLGD